MFLPCQNRTRLAALACFLAAAGLVATAGQPPEVEDPKAKKATKKVAVEEEDAKGTVKKKVVVDDPADPPAKTAPAPGGHTPDVRLDGVAAAAAATPNPAARAFLARFLVPFDRLTDSKGGVTRVRPIPLFRTDKFPPQFAVAELDAAGVPKEPRVIPGTEVKRIDYFEEVAAAEAEQWLKTRPDGLTPEDQLVAAEAVLAAALDFHDYARKKPFAGEGVPIRRHGPGAAKPFWDDARKPLDDKLRDVRLRQLDRAVSGTDWQRARQFGSKLMAAYPKDLGVADKVAVARVAEADVLMKTNAHADRVRARELLDEFEGHYPGGGGEPVRRLRKDLASEALRMFDRAKAQKAGGQVAEARNDLDRAEALDPTIPGLRDLKRELGSGYPVLYVGVRQFPERMSPATARFDSERQAVELLFEGLLEEVPDGTGGTRYRPGAALAFPAVVPGGREVLIRQVPRSANGMEGFDAHDVVETVKLLRSRPELAVAAGLPWFEGLPTPSGPGALKLAFHHGHPDPRGLLGFKLLPGRWLAEKGKKIDDPEFAARPFGTGPYRIQSLPGPGTADSPQPRELVFVENPAYGKWRDRTGQPFLREIRLVEAAKLVNPFDDFRRGRLHILPDLTPAEVTKALAPAGNELGGKGQVVTAATNRRVYTLAVNHRRAALQNLDLRKGISLAIDREEILAAVFRGTPAHLRKFTAPMAGPFPPGSWATPKTPTGQTVPLVNREEALVRLRKYLSQASAATELKLAYPTGDAQAAAACGQIKAHVEGLLRDAPRKVTLALEPVDPAELALRVREQHRYDLAYVPFDYPDDWYPLGLAAYLDPGAAGRDGRNVTGFAAAGTNADEQEQTLNGELTGLREYRDFAGQLAPRAARINQLFNDTVPFVPLWQLDRYTLIHTGVKVFVDDAPAPARPEVLNPTVLFHHVARWRLE